MKKQVTSLWIEPPLSPMDDEVWFSIPSNPVTPIDIFDNLDPVVVDTGLLDKDGKPLVRVEYRNGIGFHANIED